MLEPNTKYYYNRYKPYEPVPEFDTYLPGAYSSWAHHFMHGFAPEFVEQHYPAFIGNAVEVYAPGKAIVSFDDGEEIWGILGEGADEEGSGFYFFPADERDNNIRIFVIRSAMKELRRVS